MHNPEIFKIGSLVSMVDYNDFIYPYDPSLKQRITRDEYENIVSKKINAFQVDECHITKSLIWYNLTCVATGRAWSLYHQNLKSCESLSVEDQSKFLITWIQSKWNRHNLKLSYIDPNESNDDPEISSKMTPPGTWPGDPVGAVSTLGFTIENQIHNSWWKIDGSQFAIGFHVRSRLDGEGWCGWLELYQYECPGGLTRRPIPLAIVNHWMPMTGLYKMFDNLMMQNFINEPLWRKLGVQPD